jgi:predicted Zn-dependent protease with MMP-like domain
MEAERFEQLVSEAIENLPPAFASLLQNVEIVVQQRPNREQRKLLGLKPWQRVYGMYDGIPLTERTSDTFAPPDTIIIFRQALERDFRTAARLREEVQRTVFHEIAHFFGISDERLHDLGAY